MVGYLGSILKRMGVASTAIGLMIIGSYGIVIAGREYSESIDIERDSSCNTNFDDYLTDVVRSKVNLRNMRVYPVAYQGVEGEIEKHRDRANVGALLTLSSILLGCRIFEKRGR